MTVESVVIDETVTGVMVETVVTFETAVIIIIIIMNIQGRQLKLIGP